MPNRVAISGSLSDERALSHERKMTQLPTRRWEGGRVGGGGGVNLESPSQAEAHLELLPVGALHPANIST